MKRIFLFAVLLFVGCIVFSQSASAQVDQKCWLEKDCLEQRKSLSAEELSDVKLKEGFVQNSETIKACGTKQTATGDKIGFCLPAGQAETAISFGGQRRFSNIGVFIGEMYRYGSWAAGIIAVFMVVISGIQWMVSAGNSSMIDSAKSRISGAIIGLVLLALAYTILNMLNPYLVNFRLPNVWLINTQEIAPPSCSQLSYGSEILQITNVPNEKLTQDQKDTIASKNQYSDKFTTYSANSATSSGKCGFEYLVKGAGAQTCTGAVCVDDAGNATNAVCAPYDIDGNGYKNAGASCLTGQVVVHLKLNSLDQQFFNGSWLIGASGLQKWVGSKAVVSPPDWLELDNSKQIYYSCDGGNTYSNFEASGTYLTYEIAKAGQKGTDKTLPVVGAFDEYELHFFNLDKIKCAGGTLLGKVLFKFEIELSGDFDDPNLFIGRIGKTNQAMVSSIREAGAFAIPLDDVIKGGIYLEGELNYSGLNAIGKEPDLVPKGNGVVAPELQNAVDQINEGGDKMDEEKPFGVPGQGGY